MRRSEKLSAPIGFIGGILVLLSFSANAAPPYVSVTAGSTHACGIDTQQMVFCETASFSDRLLPPTDLGTFTALAAGEAHTCGITTSGDVSCWGDNDFGQLDVPDLLLPVSVIEGGRNHTCAIDARGAVTCWGLDSNDRLDLPFTDRVYTAISTRNGYSCAIDDAMQVSCSASVPALSNTPAPPASLNQQGVVQVEAFSDILDTRALGCAIDTAGQLECWASITQSLSFSDGPYTDVAVNNSVVCAVQQAGLLECQVYRPANNTPAFMADIPDGNNIVAVEDGFARNMCVLDSDGEIVCWGAFTGQSPPFAEDDEPRVPSTLRASVYSATTLELFWTFNGGIPTTQRYEIFRNGELLANTANHSSYLDTGLEAGVNYEYSIRAVSFDGTRSEFTEVYSVNTGESGGTGGSSGEVGTGYQPPSRSLETSGLRAEVYWENTVELFWDRKSPRVRGYEIRKDGEYFGFSVGTSFIDGTVMAGDKPDYDVIAVDVDGDILGFASIGVQIGEGQCE